MKGIRELMKTEKTRRANEKVLPSSECMQYNSACASLITESNTDEKTEASRKFLNRPIDTKACLSLERNTFGVTEEKLKHSENSIESHDRYRLPENFFDGEVDKLSRSGCQASLTSLKSREEIDMKKDEIANISEDINQPIDTLSTEHEAEDRVKASVNSEHVEEPKWIIQEEYDIEEPPLLSHKNTRHTNSCEDDIKKTMHNMTISRNADILSSGLKNKSTRTNQQQNGQTYLDDDLMRRVVFDSDIDELHIYQPFRTAFHAEILREEEELKHHQKGLEDLEKHKKGERKAPSSYSEANKMDGMDISLKGSLPKGFFDDVDADAKARGQMTSNELELKKKKLNEKKKDIVDELNCFVREKTQQKSDGERFVSNILQEQYSQSQLFDSLILLKNKHKESLKKRKTNIEDETHSNSTCAKEEEYNGERDFPISEIKRVRNLSTISEEHEHAKNVKIRGKHQQFERTRVSESSQHSESEELIDAESDNDDSLLNWRAKSLL